jgi:hypothetical protein
VAGLAKRAGMANRVCDGGDDGESGCEQRRASSSGTRPIDTSDRAAG